MKAITPFTIQVNDLKNLTPDVAVESFRRLLWAEGSAVGVGNHLINVPDCINVGDGGIDAFIKNANPSRDDLIPNGTSGFQIKSSDLQPKDCKKELHEGENLNRPIKPEIKRLLDENGTYVLVLFANISKKQRTNRENDLKEELVNLGYPDAKLRLHGADQIAGFMERFPALVAWFKKVWTECLPYSVWAGRSDITSPRQYVPGESREKLAEDIREKFTEPGNQCLVFRIVGLSGIGKTRFVFEALSSDDLRQRVIYVQADAFRFTSLYQTLQMDDNLSAIIVIDECSLQHHDEFVRAFSSRGSRLAVITLFHDPGNGSRSSALYKLGPLGKKPLEEIIKAEFTNLPGDVVSRLSEFADGYPRIAVLLGKSYIENLETTDEFLTMRDEDLINRLIAGRADTTSEHFKRNRRVLMGLSLFSKVGYQGGLSSESRWVADLIGVNWMDFEEIVFEQRQRGIIQGQYYLYVTPFMLRVYLLTEWWETHDLTVERFEEFVESIPEEFREDILQRFFEHMPFITASNQGEEFTKLFLGKKGQFSDGSLLKNSLGAKFFLNLAEADPESALECLKNTVGSWSKEELFKFKTGRREVVWALERIAVWRDLFPDAARLLLQLGEAENENVANNASGVFAGMFSLGYGIVAPTEAPPRERFPVLEEAIHSDSKERRLLALNACDKGLSQHFARMIGAEHQGIRRKPELWKPETYGELYDAYRYIWSLLYGSMNELPKDEQQRGVDILLQRSRGLTHIPALANMVIDTLGEISQKPYVNKKKVLGIITKVLHYQGRKLPVEIRQRCEDLKDELTGSGFQSLLKRYVGMDLLEDKFDEDGKSIDAAELYIKRLVEDAIDNVQLLKPELRWLITHEAQNGFRFGYELGKKDKDFSLLPMLLDAQREAKKNASDYFLGGYLRALFERDKPRLESVLDDLAKDEKLAIWVPGLTWRSGMSDRAAKRVLCLAQKGIIGAANFRIFCLGSVIWHISEDIFKSWMDYLLSSGEDEAIFIALDLYDFYYLRKESKHKLPSQYTLKLLTQPSFFHKPKSGRPRQSDEFNWNKICKRFVDIYPKKSLVISDKMLEHFGEKGTIFEDFYSQTHEVLNYIAQMFPGEVWEQISKRLGPPIDSRAFCIKEWLRETKQYIKGGVEGALMLFSPDKVWQWVDKDVDKRAWYLASFVPKVLSHEKDRVCWAREILVKYGNLKDVRGELIANFFTEGWTGLASHHYQMKKQRLLDFKKKENNENQ